MLYDYQLIPEIMTVLTDDALQASAAYATAFRSLHIAYSWFLEEGCTLPSTRLYIVL